MPTSFARAVVCSLAFGALCLSPARGDARGVQVTEIRIKKTAHTLELLKGAEVVARYSASIGPGGPGPKRMEGDRVTPVGHYKVTGRIKNLFHQFLVVSYPNADDLKRYAEAKRRGEIPRGRGVGNSIGIHGGNGDAPSDWTLGCIALTDAQIDEVASQVKDGTPITITDE